VAGPEHITAVTGGTVVTPGGLVRADVLIRDGKVAGLGDHSGVDGPRLDAAGCYVLPGGVDPHCHLMAGFGPATAAAVRGGTTTVLSFTGPAAGERDLDALLRNRAELDRDGAAADVGLNAVIYGPDRLTEDDLAAAQRAGAGAIKIFLAYPELGIMCSTGRLYELMSGAARAGLLVQVHCENAPLIDALVDDALRAEAATPGAARAGARIFADTRPPEVEEEAVARTLAVASLAGAACYLVHLSTAGAVDQVRLARRRGTPRVFAEVCTHHLVLDEARYAGADAERYLVAPPLRAPHHVEALWEGLADGTIDAVGSDHGQVKSMTTGSLADAGHLYGYGLAGAGPRLPVLLSAAAARGLPIERVVQLAAENPARAFGHYPAKGVLAAGSDADIVVYDPSGRTVLPDDGFGDETGDSVYAGLAVQGQVRDVLLRGQVVVSAGTIVDRHHGRYLPSPRPLSAGALCAGECTLASVKSGNSGRSSTRWRQLLSQQHPRLPAGTPTPSWTWSAGGWSLASLR
jgi:dihydropyrimidinase